MQALITFFQNEIVIQAIGFLGMGFSLLAAIINDCITIFCLLLAILRIDIIPAICARRAAKSGNEEKHDA